MFIWVKVFKNGPSKICGRQPLKNLKCYGLPKHNTLANVMNHNSVVMLYCVSVVHMFLMKVFNCLERKKESYLLYFD